MRNTCHSLAASERQGLGGIQGAAFSRDESRILSWGGEGTIQDGAVRLWDAATGSELIPAMHHGGSVQGAAFSRDDGRILSWGQDGTIRLWDAATGSELVPAMHHERAVRGAKFSYDEKHILSWEETAIVRLWDISRLPAGNLLEVACKLMPSWDVSELDGVYGIRITDPICGSSMPPPDWPQMR